MRLMWLSRVAIFFEASFILWYVVMTITLFRGLRRDFDALTAGMAAVSVARLLATLWMIALLYLLAAPAAGQLEWLLVIKLALDLVMTAAITFFMWHLQFKPLIKEWLKNGDPP